VPPTTAPHLLVVGGGVTGLAAAWEAVSRGAAVTVVEAGVRWGGKVWTERVDGLVIDHGPDAFITYKRAALELVDELGLSERLVEMSGARDVQLRAGGRLHPIPAGMGMVLPTRVGPFLTTRTLSWRHKLRAALDLALPRRLEADDVAVGAFLRARLGDGVVDRFADPMVGGVYGSRVDELSLDAALPMLRDSEARYRSMILASLVQGRAARRGGVTRGVGSPFRSLDDGLGVLVEGLVDALTTAGADLRLGARVTAVRPDGATTFADLSDGTSASYAGVVLATGSAPAAGLLAPHAPDAAAALHGIPLASTTVLNLAYAASAFTAPPTFQGWLEADDAPASAVTVTSAKWPGRAPEGTVLLRVLVPDKVGPTAALGDADLLAAVTAYLGEVLGVRGEPALYRIARWTGVMPQYTVGHLVRVAALEAGLAAYPTWRVAGAALRGVGLPDCIAGGRAATRTVLEAVAG
jgi:oxygen-dependent protoporphyrinogen oxidase